MSPRPSFTSSPKSSSDSLTPFASAHLQVSARSNIRVWDAALSCALLQKFGITVIDDSRAFSIQMRKGFEKGKNKQPRVHLRTQGVQSSSALSLILSKNTFSSSSSPFFLFLIFFHLIFNFFLIYAKHLISKSVLLFVVAKQPDMLKCVLCYVIIKQ